MDNEDAEYSEKKIEVIAEEIFGIVYYIDNENNEFYNLKVNLFENEEKAEFENIVYINENENNKYEFFCKKFMENNNIKDLDELKIFWDTVLSDKKYNKEKIKELKIILESGNYIYLNF